MPPNNRRILPHDVAMWVYLGILSGLIVIFRENLPRWQNYLFFNFSAAFLVFGAYWYLNAPNGWQRFIRHIYPLLFFTFLYEESGRLIHLVHPIFFDHLVNQLEMAALGVYPTIWLENFYHPWLNEIFMLGYVSYYFLMPTLAVALYLKNKIQEIDHFMLAVSIGFYISYLTFILFPVEGPRRYLIAFEGREFLGPVFTLFAKWVIGNFAIHGGCVPSSHVAVSFITLILALRFYRKVGLALTPFVITLCIGTFWGRFHYITDTASGLILGWFAVVVADLLMARISGRIGAG